MKSRNNGEAVIVNTGNSKVVTPGKGNIRVVIWGKVNPTVVVKVVIGEMLLSIFFRFNIYIR